METLAIIDEYGTGSAIIEVIRYMYKGMAYIKATRRVVRKEKLNTIFNLPETAVRMVGSTILGSNARSGDGCLGFVDEYGNGSAYIELEAYTHQNRPYIRATRTIVSKNKTYTLFNLPRDTANEVSKIVA